MTGDPTRDNAATPHDFASPDVPWDDNDYRAHQQAAADKAAARAERYRKKRQEMDAAHEKAKAERCLHCALGKEHEREGEGE